MYRTQFEVGHFPHVVLGLVSAKVPLSKMSRSDWMNLSGQDGDIWKLLDYRLGSLEKINYEREALKLNI